MSAVHEKQYSKKAHYISTHAASAGCFRSPETNLAAVRIFTLRILAGGQTPPPPTLPSSKFSKIKKHSTSIFFFFSSLFYKASIIPNITGVSILKPPRKKVYRHST